MRFEVRTDNAKRNPFSPDDPGMIGKGYADLHDLPWKAPEPGSFGNWPSWIRISKSIPAGI
jgi:hypothetical protein